MVKITGIFLVFMVVFTSCAMEPGLAAPLASVLRQGRLTVITGPMFSGKSEELIKRVNLSRLGNLKVVVFKPHIDSRSGSFIRTRSCPKAMEAISIPENEPELMFNCVDLLVTNIVAIDEVQFFSKYLVFVIERFLSNQIHVIVSGLDKDFRGEPFGECMPTLLSKSDECVKLYAMCNQCKRFDASLTQRLFRGHPVNGDSPLVVVDDGKEGITYEPRCRSCHQVLCGWEENDLKRSPEVEDFTDSSYYRYNGAE